ncbi:MAG: 4 protein [Chloroflexota bacterium]|nr:4 protein [Chloroflexota bacterium]
MSIGLRRRVDRDRLDSRDLDLRQGRGSGGVGQRLVCQTPRVAHFQYDPQILERFPTIVGGVIHATGVHNGSTPPELAAAFHAEMLAARERIGPTPLSELPTIGAWRRVFRGFGVDPTQYRSAAESLLRRLTKQGELPSIGTLVDLANLVSIRYALPVAVFDRGRISGGMTVRFARGDEHWSDLGASEAVHPETGEVVFVDEAGIVSARRWCWRQSAGSAAQEDTTEILITVEGHHPTAEQDVTRALADLEGLLLTHATASMRRTAVLTPSRSLLD